MNIGNGYSWSCCDILCKNHNNEFMIFEEKIEAEMFLLENEELMKKWNSNSDEIQFYIEEVKKIKV